MSILFGATLLVGGIVAGPMRGGAIPGMAGTLRDPLSLMGDRSPGARKGVLINTKAAYAPAPKDGERHFGTGHAPIIPGAANDLTDPKVISEPPILLPEVVPAGYDHVPPEGYPGPSGPPGPPDGGPHGPPVPPPGPPVPPPGPPLPPPGPPVPPPGPPVVTPVPEPSTWALMIVGMGLVGAAMRRRNAGLADAATAA